MVWLAKNDVNKALADLNQSIEIDPQGLQAYCHRPFGVATSNIEKAIADCEDPLFICRDAYQICAVRTANGEHDEALDEFDSAIRLDPHGCLAYGNRAIIWLMKKEIEKAIEDLSHAIRLNPADVSYYTSRAYAWSLKKEYHKAAVDYGEAFPRMEEDSRPRGRPR